MSSSFAPNLKLIDADYENTAQRLREIAESRYGCVGVSSFQQNNEELTLTYWESAEDIAAWRRDPEHIMAQRIGAEKWYEWYLIQVATIDRAYHSAILVSSWAPPRPPRLGLAQESEKSAASRI